MLKLKNDLFGLHCPFFYRLDIIRDAESSYVANLGDTHVFTGYYTNDSDILSSKSLIMLKAELLQDDPRVTENGNGYVQVHFVDGIRCEQYLIYDSSQTYKGNRGITRQIIDNLKKEVDVLWSYIGQPSEDIVFVDDDGEKYPYIIPSCCENCVDPSFLEPLSDDAWHFKSVGLNQAMLMADAQEQDANLGIYWMHGTYRSEQVEIEDAA